MELFGGRLLLQIIEEWSQLRPGYNWRTFHPVMAEVEDDRILGAVEMTVVVLGIGLRVRWTYTETEEMGRIITELEGVKDRITRPEVTP